MDSLPGTGVAILLAYDGHRVVGPGPHLRCTGGMDAARVEAVGFPDRAAAVAALEKVKVTLRDANLNTGPNRGPLVMTLYPALTVRRAA